MALINCPECNKQISDKAKSCPNCGSPIKRQKNKFKKGTVFITFGIVLIIGGFAIWSNAIDAQKYIEQHREEYNLRNNLMFIATINRDDAGRKYLNKKYEYLKYTESDADTKVLGSMIFFGFVLLIIGCIIKIRNRSKDTFEEKRNQLPPKKETQESQKEEISEKAGQILVKHKYTPKIILDICKKYKEKTYYYFGPDIPNFLKNKIKKVRDKFEITEDDKVIAMACFFSLTHFGLSFVIFNQGIYSNEVKILWEEFIESELYFTEENGACFMYIGNNNNKILQIYSEKTFAFFQELQTAIKTSITEKSKKD